MAAVIGLAAITGRSSWWRWRRWGLAACGAARGGGGLARAGGDRGAGGLSQIRGAGRLVEPVAGPVVEALVQPVAGCGAGARGGGGTVTRGGGGNGGAGLAVVEALVVIVAHEGAVVAAVSTGRRWRLVAHEGAVVGWHGLACFPGSVAAPRRGSPEGCSGGRALIDP